MAAAGDNPSVQRTEWILLLCLAAILGLEILGWGVARRTDRELGASIATAPPGEKAWSLHVLLNRGEGPAIDRAQVEELLASDQPLVREMAMTSDVWRLAGRAAQWEHLNRVAERGEAVRGRYYLKWHGQPVRRKFLRTYFRSLEAGADDTD
jgi:hypothetical protein